MNMLREDKKDAQAKVKEAMYTQSLLVQKMNQEHHETVQYYQEIMERKGMRAERDV